MDDLQRWYDRGRETNARWLLITWDCVDREWVPVYRTDMEGAVWEEGGHTWTCQWVVDLNLPVSHQSRDIYLAEEP